MRMLSLLLLLCWSTGVGAAPLDEICQILRTQALYPPAEELLATMTNDNFQDVLRQIDPYARVFSTQAYTPQESTSWIGIGAALAMRGDQAVLHTYHGGGADLAGVPDRSRLLAIDDQPIHGQNAEEIATQLRGKPGTSVRLRLTIPSGVEQTFVVRREIFAPLNVELVDAAQKRVVRVHDFTAGLTRSAMRATLEFLARQNADATLIVDLRDSPGGDLYEAFDLAGLFLPAGTLLGTIADRHGSVLDIRSPSGAKYSNPMLLLIGPETASAAEIFAGIVRHYDRAHLVGQPSYGKCSSQTDTHLSDGSVLRFTNKKVLLPDGNSCQGTGLSPDLAVSDTDIDLLSQLVEQAQTLLHVRSESTPNPD